MDDPEGLEGTEISIDLSAYVSALDMNKNEMLTRHGRGFSSRIYAPDPFLKRFH